MLTASRGISGCMALAMLVSLHLAGCNSGSDVRTFSEEDNVRTEDPHAHDHAHGPHGGHVVELGGEDYHAEVTLDQTARKLTVYLLAADLKTPLPVEAASISVRLKVAGETQEVTLTAQPQAEDGEGKASQFVQSEGTLPESIKDAEGLEGEVVVQIGETQYRGPITHDHDHDHGHDH